MAMQLTKAGEYAVRSLIYLAKQEADTRAMASEVASAENIPVNFVRKILESLAKTGLVKSFRGAGGGFMLGRDAKEISLRQIIEAVEGPFALNECLAVGGCERKDVCTVSRVWRETQHAVETILERHSLHDLIHPSSRELAPAE